MKKILVLAVLAALFAFPAFAAVGDVKEDVPLLSAQRLQVAVGAQYAWYSGQDGSNQEIPTFGKEFEVGAFAAYNLVPNVDLVAGSAYGLDNKVFRTTLGVRLVLFRGVK